MTVGKVKNIMVDRQCVEERKKLEDSESVNYKKERPVRRLRWTSSTCNIITWSNNMVMLQ